MKYGWIRDSHDARDFRYSVPARAGSLPPKVDLREHASQIYNQGSLGSCTANAIAAALVFLQNQSRPNYSPDDPSRLFIYYNERRREGTVSEDAGAMIRDGIKSVSVEGFCTELEWPYDISKFTVKPPQLDYRNGRRHIVKEYQRIDNRDLDALLACLADGFPFVFGFTVFKSFESKHVATTGAVPMPSRGDSPLGGHAVLAVGYNRRTRRFLVQNSWGAGWGRKGYFTIPFDYLTNSNLADDFWTIRLL